MKRLCVDWNALDLEKLDVQKVEFIFAEASKRKDAVIANTNNLQSKASWLLAFCVASMSFVLGLLFEHKGTLAGADLNAVLALASALFLAVLCLIFCLWPKGVALSGGGAEEYLQDGFYQSEYVLFLLGSIRGCVSDTARNSAINGRRGWWLKLSLLCIIGSAPVCAVVWLVT